MENRSNCAGKVGAVAQFRAVRRLHWRHRTSFDPERIEDMAFAMTLEQGKPVAQSRLEILRGCEIIEWDASEGRRTCGRIVPSGPGIRHMVLRQPISVVAAFSPWILPMSSPAWKVGGALSAGCSIILKVSGP